MSVIRKEIELVGSKGRAKVNSIFDSGATYSCIRPELAEELGNLEPLPKLKQFITAKEGEKVSAKYAVRLDFYIDGLLFSDEFMVVEGLSRDVIIGSATMQKWGMKLDFKKERVILKPEVTELMII